MKIDNPHPFNEYTCYKIFHKKLGRWQVSLVSKEKRRTLLFSKYLMSVHLGRELTVSEEVDHINGDKADDRLENLEVVSRTENRRRQAAMSSRTTVELVCPHCKTSFVREKRQTHLAKGRGLKTYCSRSCVGKSVHNP